MSARVAVTVVGNGVAGWACASALASAGARVTMIGPGLPYDRPPLSKRALETGRVPYLAGHADISGRGVSHVDGLVTQVHMDGRRLTVRPQAAEGPLQVPFERLVWATGLAVRRPPFPGGEAAHVNATADGLQALLPLLKSPGRRVAVVGAGLIGSETAAMLSRRHRVLLLEHGPRPLARFPQPVVQAAQAALAQCGVRLVTECGIERAERAAGGGPWLLATSEHGRFEVDVMVGATGVAGTLPAGLDGERGAVLDTDHTLAVRGLDGVWACGDVARFPHPRHGAICVPHHDHARASGAHAAAAALGSRAAYVREPYWFSDIGPLRMQQVGLAEAACEWADVDGMQVGLDAAGRPACVVLLGLPSRLRDARELVGA
jgi:3-phenylpropionate/trans-cinnamate dioxygenase ferredoxin reductase component